MCFAPWSEKVEIRMRRLYAVAISLALLVATPGVATAYPYPRPAGNQQAIDFVTAPERRYAA